MYILVHYPIARGSRESECMEGRSRYSRCTPYSILGTFRVDEHQASQPSPDTIAGSGTGKLSQGLKLAARRVRVVVAVLVMDKERFGASGVRSTKYIRTP